MKKTISILLCLYLLLSVSAAIPQSDNTPQDDDIEGLREQLETLWMGNYFSAEQLDSLLHQRIEAYIEDFWSMPWIERQMIQWRDIEYDNPEDELASRLATWPSIAMEDSLRVTFLNTLYLKYANEYAQRGNFEYLFSDEIYWTSGHGFASTPNGKLIKGWNSFYPNHSPARFYDEDRDFLKDTDGLEGMLRATGVTEVYDVKLFSMSIANVLYLRCDNDSYLLRFSDHTGGITITFPGFEVFRLYTIQEAMEIIADSYRNHDGELLDGFGLARNVAAEKPAFESEAEALQAAGLLQGNEKGLDLYKPLSRIEAVTLLVRALGLEGESATPQSRFADIPDGSWGVKYANIAAEQGITLGTGNGNFAPNALVTDDQFATFLLRAVDAPEFDWETAIQVLIDQGILTAEEAKTMDFFTRGDMAKIIYEAREKGLL